MKILSVECSALSAGAAITDESKLLGECYVNSGLTHSRTLMPMVENVLKNTETDINDIDVFAVTAGPGSFTGVRIGVAAVKGLAFTNNKPCIALSSTEVIAYPFKMFDGVVCAVMDARCNQVYTACFKNGKRLCDDDAILIDELANRLSEYDDKILFAGDGAALCYNALKEKFNNVFLSAEQLRYPRASSVCFAALEKITNGADTIQAKDLLPVYLRLPQAQRELNNKNSKLKKGE